MCVYGPFLWQCCTSDASSLPGQDGSQTLKLIFWSDRSQIKLQIMASFKRTIVACCAGLGLQLICPCLPWCIVFNFLVRCFLRKESGMTLEAHAHLKYSRRSVYRKGKWLKIWRDGGDNGKLKGVSLSLGGSLSRRKKWRGSVLPSTKTLATCPKMHLMQKTLNFKGDDFVSDFVSTAKSAEIYFFLFTFCVQCLW